MKANFFKKECCSTTNESHFGLCDKDDKKPAFINVDKSEKWIATVVNCTPPKTIQFLAIDNCVEIFRENGEMDNKCDVLLQYDTRLLFVELKTKRADWKYGGLGQIENTVKRMIDDYPDFYYGFKKRKAIVANPKFENPSFQDSDVEYKMHVQFDAEIKID